LAEQCNTVSIGTDKCSSARLKFDQLDKYCPPTPGGDTYTKESCGNSICHSHLAEIKDSDINQLAEDLKSCPNLGIDLSKDDLQLIATSRAWDCGFSEAIGFTLDTCLAAVKTVKIVGDACPEDLYKENTKASCGNKQCSAAISKIDSKTFTEIDNGMKSCLSTYGDPAFLSELPTGEELKQDLVKLAYNCDLMPSLKVPLSDCLAGAKIYFDIPKYCPGAGEGDIQARSRSSTSCGDTRCQEFLKTLPNATSFASLLSTCSSNFDPDIRALADFDKDTLAENIAIVAEQCGLEGSVRADNKCLAAVKLIRGLENSCPRTCTQSMNGSKLERCVEDQDERSVLSCGNPRCKDFLTSVDPEAMKMLASDLSSCKDQRFKGLQASQEDLEYSFIGAAYECDFAEVALTTTLKNSLTTCSKASIKAYDSLVGNCKPQCGLPGLRTCRSDEKQMWSVATCGTGTCKSKLQLITSTQALYDDMMGCTGKLKEFWTDIFDSANSFKVAVARVESDCGHDGVVPAKDLGPCVSVERKTRAIVRACPRQCAKFFPENGLRECKQGSNEFERYICERPECAAAVKNFTNTQIDEIAAIARTCPDSKHIDLSSLRGIKAGVVKNCLAKEKDAEKEKMAEELESRFKVIQEKLNEKDDELSAAQNMLTGLQEKVDELEKTTKQNTLSEDEKLELEDELNSYKVAVKEKENTISATKAAKKTEKEKVVKAQLEAATTKKAKKAVLREYAAKTDNDADFAMVVSLADVIDIKSTPAFKKIENKTLKMKRIYKSKEEASKAPVEINTLTSAGNEELYFPIDDGDFIKMVLGTCDEPALFTGLAEGMVQMEVGGVTTVYDIGEEATSKACGWMYKFLIGSVTTAGSEPVNEASTAGVGPLYASLPLAVAATLLTALLL
jgi:hypothetical protein